MKKLQLQQEVRAGDGEEVLSRGIFPVLDKNVPSAVLTHMLRFRLVKLSTTKKAKKDGDILPQLHVQRQCSQCSRFCISPNSGPKSSLCCLECCGPKTLFVLCRVCVLNEAHGSGHTVLLYVDGVCQGQVVQQDEQSIARAGREVELPKQIREDALFIPKPMQILNPDVQALENQSGKIIYFVNKRTGESAFHLL